MIPRGDATSRPTSTFAKNALIGIEEDSAGMLKDLAREGITSVDISVNLSIKGNRNVPHDGHPSFKAHQAYSLRLFEFLNETASQY